MPNAIALDRAPRYFGEFLSENIIETPQGYRICKNVVIARTGFQTYKVREIDDPQGLLSNFKQDDEIELWRDQDEVFSAATIASFEGMPVTLQHPEEMLDLDNTHESQVGHAQNVRKGTEPLEDGNLPLLSDLFITHAEAVQAIDNGVREVSCGYYYTLAKSGKGFDQTNLRGNHIAIVQKARAGDEARICDSAPEPPSKEKPVSWLKNLVGRGLKEFAKDAKPEELAEAVEGIQKETAAVNGNGNGNGERRSYRSRHRSRARDAESASPSVSASDAVSQSASSSAEDDDVLKHPETAAPKSAFDAAHRQRLHDALDAVIAEHEKKGKDAENKEKESLDAAAQELKDLFGEEESASGSSSASDQSSSEEVEIPENLTSDSASAENPADDQEEGEEGGEAEVISEGDADKEEGEDADKEVVRPEPVLKEGERQKKAFDSAGIRLARKTLIALKPFVARTRDAKLAKAFDTAFRGLRRMEKSGSRGSYARVREATRHAVQAQDEGTEQKSQAEVAAASYDASMKQRMEKDSEKFKTLTSRK